MELSQILSDAMAARGLSIRQCAKEAGVSASYLSDILGGREKPGEASVRRLAAALNLEPEDLVIVAGRMFPVGSTRRTAADLLAQNRELRARLQRAEVAS